MRSPKAKAYIRISLPDGSRPHCPPVYSGNHKIKPQYALVNGKPEHHPEGVYYLRYSAGGKRHWELVGSDATLVASRLNDRNYILAGGKLASEPEAEPEPIAGQVPLADSVSEYLKETRDHKGYRTFLAYRCALQSFQRLEGDKTDRTYKDEKREQREVPVCINGREMPTRTMPVERIQRKDIMSWMGELKEAKLDLRTISNRVTFLRTFMRHFKVMWPLERKDMPHPTPKPPVPYSSRELALLLEHATQDETDLVMFFLGSGAREQEVQFATWRDISFDEGLFFITEKADDELTWTPKDKEEGQIPLPEELVERLKARRLRYPHTRLIFATEDGKTNGHMLRIVKTLALRAGINCGECLDRKGRSCAAHPVCQRAILHRFRKSFAFLHSESGINVRTIQSWLRHSSLDTTLGYLSASDNKSPVIRAKVNSAFRAITAGVRNRPQVEA